MRESRSDWIFGTCFLVLGIASLFVALRNQTVILGTGLCLALAVMFFRRARR